MVKWKVYFWFFVLMLLSLHLMISLKFMSDGWTFSIPLFISLVGSIIPVYLWVVIWRQLKQEDIGDTYLENLFFRKNLVSCTVMITGFMWCWWSGDNALIIGIPLLSLLSSILFWMVRSKDLFIVLPQGYRVFGGRERGANSECFKDGLKATKHYINPSSGLPMINSSFDVNGNVFGRSHSNYDDY